MIISFAGHAFVCSNSKVKETVKEQIKNNIDLNEKVVFYLGGYGEFDEICALACRELKQEYNNIELIYVTPYFGLSEQLKIKEMQKYGYCDMSIYPPIEKTPPRYAILKRNEWVVKNSDIIIVYINHFYGGAYKSFQAAKRKGKKIINIYDLI